MTFKELTTCEAQIMNVLWDYSEDLSVADLTEEIWQRYEHDNKRSTMATFLQRLIDKGYVRTYRIRKFSYVHAEITRQRYKEMVAENQVFRLYDGKLIDLCACFCQGHGLTKEEICELKDFFNHLGEQCYGLS